MWRLAEGGGTASQGSGHEGGAALLAINKGDGGGTGATCINEYMYNGGQR